MHITLIKSIKRIGHVFQDRYKSEAIESQGYLLAGIRYVHMNPVKANMVKEVSKYRWSSYNLYNEEYNNYNNLIESEEILGRYSQNEEDGIKLFVEFTNKENQDKFIDIKTEDEMNLKEERAKKFIRDFIKSKNMNIEITEIKNDKKLSNELIRELKE